MISTLNAAFSPDYDFSDAKSHEFSKEPSSRWVMNFVDNNLSATLGDHYRNGVRSVLWATIEDEISMNECDIYRYLNKSTNIIFSKFTSHKKY